MSYRKLERVWRNGRHIILYESIEEDHTGLGGLWQGAGVFAEIFEVQNVFILQNVFNSKPFAVFTSLNEIDEFLKTSIDGTENKTSVETSGPDAETAPVRLLALFGGDYGS